MSSAHDKIEIVVHNHQESLSLNGDDYKAIEGDGLQNSNGDFKETSRNNRFLDFLSGDKVPGNFGKNTDIIPEWFDENMLERGLEIGQEYVIQLEVATTIGSILMSQRESLMEPLMYANKTDDWIDRRIANTFEYFITNLSDALWDPKSHAYKCNDRLRTIHRNVLKRLTTVNQPKDKEGGVWMSQLDIALTIFATVGPMTLFPEALGFHCAEKDFECLNMFYRYVGHQTGAMDEYNLCRGTFQETKLICQEILDNICLPSLLNPKPEYTLFLKNSIHSLVLFTYFIDYKALVNWAYELADLNEPFELTVFGKFCRTFYRWFSIISRMRRIFNPALFHLQKRWLQEYRQRSSEPFSLSR